MGFYFVINLMCPGTGAGCDANPDEKKSCIYSGQLGAKW